MTYRLWPFGWLLGITFLAGAMSANAADVWTCSWSEAIGNPHDVSHPDHLPMLGQPCADGFRPVLPHKEPKVLAKCQDAATAEPLHSLKRYTGKECEVANKQDHVSARGEYRMSTNNHKAKQHGDDG